MVDTFQSALINKDKERDRCHGGASYDSNAAYDQLTSSKDNEYEFAQFETFFNQRHIMKDNVNFDQDTTNAATRKFRVINVHLRLSDWVSMLGEKDRSDGYSRSQCLPKYKYWPWCICDKH